MLRRGLIALLAGLLAACGAMPPRHSIAELEAAEFEVEFTLRDAKGLNAAQLDAAERARLDEVVSKCYDPAAEMFGGGVARAFGPVTTIEDALTQARAIGTLTDRRMRECLDGLGLVGSIYMVTARDRLTLPGYIDAFADIARWQRTRSSASPQWPVKWMLGCGRRGGPGWRRPDGKCAAWTD